MPQTRPVVIAHRGASAYLPEHTAEAKVYAHACGADFIEQDVVLSKDGIPVVLHDTSLNSISNVAQVFPDRARSDGRHYAIDFTLEELQLIRGLNHSTGRNAGIYPEIKAPAWHRRNGRDPLPVILQTLADAGYEGPDANCWVQCFEADQLQRARREFGSRLPMTQLIGDGRRGDPVNDYDYMRTAEGLDDVATWANGIGPKLSHIIHGDSPATAKPSELVPLAHERGLVVHPYTLRDDGLPSWADNFDQACDLLCETAGVDGLFTDFPDLMVRWRQQSAA